ncbi:hypothetical protein Tco_0558439 [Tanacetum coccineum]
MLNRPWAYTWAFYLSLARKDIKPLNVYRRAQFEEPTIIPDDAPTGEAFNYPKDCVDKIHKSAGNRVKDIVNEVEDYLKTYSLAEMDISWVENVFEPDSANNSGTNNVVGEDDLPQLLDSRGGSHVTNVPQLDVEYFTSWKDRFLVYLDGLEPFLLEILENGPFVPKSTASTHENFLPKPQKQWNVADRKLANQDKRLKSIIISCEKVKETYIRLKILLNELDNTDVKIPQAEDSDSDVEEDTRSSSEFLADLNAEFHDKSLLAN